MGSKKNNKHFTSVGNTDCNEFNGSEQGNLCFFCLSFSFDKQFSTWWMLLFFTNFVSICCVYVSVVFTVDLVVWVDLERGRQINTLKESHLCWTCFEGTTTIIWGSGPGSSSTNSGRAEMWENPERDQLSAQNQNSEGAETLTGTPKEGTVKASKTTLYPYMRRKTTSWHSIIIV